MEAHVKLPRELEEEILSRLPPQSLVRFRSVCKRWNALLHEKCFINSHLSRSHLQYIFLNDSKIYSINIIGLDGIHPTTELRELALSDFPDMDKHLGNALITAFDEFLFCTSWSKHKRTALWNPWLKQVRFIDYMDARHANFYAWGLGYNNTLSKKVYKIFGFHSEFGQRRFAIYECASHAFKFIDTLEDWSVKEANQPHLSLNGNLYWVAHNPKTHDYFIKSFDFSEEIFKPFCSLPCPKDQSGDHDLVLAVFKGDRFSLLRQCNVTRKIEILVMETKTTDNNNKGDVVWINLMTLPANNLPNFNIQIYNISYFIYDKTLIMCWCDFITETARIYILRGDMLKDFQISPGFVLACSCVYAPNFTPVPLLGV